MTDNSLERRKIVIRKGQGKKANAVTSAVVTSKAVLIAKAKSGNGKPAPVVKDDPKDDPKDGDDEPLGALNQHVADRDMSWETDSMLQDMLDGLTKDEQIDSKLLFCLPLTATVNGCRVGFLFGAIPNGLCPDSPPPTQIERRYLPR